MRKKFVVVLMGVFLFTQGCAKCRTACKQTEKCKQESSAANIVCCPAKEEEIKSLIPIGVKE